MENRFVESVRLLRLEYEYGDVCESGENVLGPWKGGTGAIIIIITMAMVL